MPPFFIRILIAIFLPLSLWSMTFVASQKFFWLLGPVALATYLIPTIEAVIRKSPDALAIGALNIFLGWTFLGWVIALVWSLRSKEDRSVKPKATASGPYSRDVKPSEQRSKPAAYVPTLPDTKKPEMKQCQFCAEEILAAAIICKHCRSDVSKPETIKAN